MQSVQHASLCLYTDIQPCTDRWDAAQVTNGRQLLAVEDAEAVEYRCRDPIAPANEKYCEALFRTLNRCRRQFGRFTLRCTPNGATACSTSLAQIRNGRCSAHYLPWSDVYLTRAQGASRNRCLMQKVFVVLLSLRAPSSRLDRVYECNTVTSSDTGSET